MLYFHNPGEIDIRGATVAGLSAKDKDSPIGFFGTGLKYSIACVLRWGGTISICSGLDVYKFGIERIQFRDKSFMQITMSVNGGLPIALGFTTEYGKTWCEWQVFRELYANALDEHGNVSQQRVAPAEGTTVIMVECEPLEREFFNRDEIILPAAKQYDFTCAAAKLVNKPADHVYYRGVRVMQKPCAATYNVIQQLQLTEDRTLRDHWSVQGRIREALQQCTDESLIERALEADRGYFEHELSFCEYSETSPEFIAVASRLYKQNPTKHERLRHVLCRKDDTFVKYTPVELTATQQMMLKRAIKLVGEMEMPEVDHTSITVVELGKETLGRMENGKVYLSPLVLKQGTKQVVSTLYEEMLHLKSGMSDLTYAMQTYLFNKIVDMYEEHVWQEPC